MSRMKTKTKRWIGAIALVLAAVALCAVLGNLSDGFQKGPSEWKLREVNPDNLYQTVAFAATDGVIMMGDAGVTVELVEDNVIKVNGNVAEDKAVTLGVITLKKGCKYIFSTSLGKTSAPETVYLSLNNSQGETICKAYGASVLIDATAWETDMSLSLVMNLKAGTDVNNISLRPVICVGESADDLISFYK